MQLPADESLAVPLRSLHLLCDTLRLPEVMGHADMLCLLPTHRSSAGTPLTFLPFLGSSSPPGLVRTKVPSASAYASEVTPSRVGGYSPPTGGLLSGSSALFPLFLLSSCLWRHLTTRTAQSASVSCASNAQWSTDASAGSGVLRRATGSFQCTIYRKGVGAEMQPTCQEDIARATLRVAIDSLKLAKAQISICCEGE